MCCVALGFFSHFSPNHCYKFCVLKKDVTLVTGDKWHHSQDSKGELLSGTQIKRYYGDHRMVWYLSCACTASCGHTSLPCSEAVKVVCASSIQGHSRVGTFHPLPGWWHSSPQLSSSAVLLFVKSVQNSSCCWGSLRLQNPVLTGEYGKRWGSVFPLLHKVTSARNSFCITWATTKLVLDELSILPRMNPKILNKIVISEYYDLGEGGVKCFWPLFDFGMINLLSWLDSLEFLYLSCLFPCCCP